MPRYGIMSIGHHFTPDQFAEFDHLYDAVGQNTGNLLFSTAVWRQVGGQKRRLRFRVNSTLANAELDALIIPAANWLSPGTDLGEFAGPIEELKIPVILVGLGAQHPSTGDMNIEIPEGTIRFVKAVAERSQSISVRGDYTRRVLEQYGIYNVTVTGCPSLYSTYHQNSTLGSAETFHLDRCLVHSTRYSARHSAFATVKSVNRSLFRFAYEKQLDLLIQSEPEELKILFGFSDQDPIDEATQKNLKKIYKEKSFDRLETYIRKHAKAFLHIRDWSGAIQEYQLVCGTRLHGTIMALNSGVRGVLLHHDSRTKEIADFAAIPSIDSQKLDLSASRLQKLYEDTDFSQFYRRREQNRTIYREFLQANNIELGDV